MTESILLEIAIKIESVTEIHGGGKSICLVCFGGNASSRFFKGTVMPGAADMQIHNKNKPTELSARYILEGVDCENNNCKIFIENNGAEKDGSIITKPFIITDSPTLKWLETTDLYGEVISENGNVIIRIYGDERK